MSAQEIGVYVDGLSDQEFGVLLEAVRRRCARSPSSIRGEVGVGTDDDPWSFLVPLDEMRGHLRDEDLAHLPTTETLDATLYGSTGR